MALSIKSDHANRLARELATATGETLTEAVVVSLEERLGRVTGGDQADTRDRLRRLQERARDLPTSDLRTDDEIVGYDRSGIPA